VAINTSLFRSETAQRLRAEGREEGRKEALEEFRQEGRVRERAAGVLRILRHRRVPVTAAERSRIESCADLELLGVWFDRALTAASVAEVFG
jgi:hypothetical protein